MTSKTLVSRSTPNAEFVTVVSEQFPLDCAYSEKSTELVFEKEEVQMASRLVEVERPNPGVAFIQGTAVIEGPEGISFNGIQELSSNVRNYFLGRPRYQPSFENIPAFGMWADREESDEELLRELGSQWGGGELE